MLPIGRNVKFCDYSSYHKSCVGKYHPKTSDQHDSFHYTSFKEKEGITNALDKCLIQVHRYKESRSYTMGYAKSVILNAVHGIDDIQGME